MSADEMTEDLEFEREIANFSPEGRFLSRQVRELKTDCSIYDKRIKALEDRDTKTYALSGGVGTVLGSVIVFLIDFFRGR